MPNPTPSTVDDGPVPWRLLALVCGVILLDGFDIQLAAFAGPAILKEWALGPASLAPAIAAALVGMAIGTAVGGFLGDRVGRRPAMIFSVVWFGGWALASAHARDVNQLALLRLLTGLGLGAVVPAAMALVAEGAPARIRAYAVTAVVVGVPFGGMLGAALASWLIPAHGWRAAFLAGGVLPLVLALLMWRFLPESPDFGRAEVQGDRLLGPELRRSAIGLSLAFLASMLALYACLSWIPVVLASVGLPQGDAIRGSMLFNLCGVAASFAGAWLTTRIGSRGALLTGCSLGVVGVGVWAVLILTPGMSSAARLAGVAAAGVGVGSLQVMLYGLATQVFPAERRAAGIGYAAAFGRLGAIASALGAGLVLSLPVGKPMYFAAIALAVAATAAAVLVIDRHAPPITRPGRRA